MDYDNIFDRYESGWFETPEGAAALQQHPEWKPLVDLCQQQDQQLFEACWDQPDALNAGMEQTWRDFKKKRASGTRILKWGAFAAAAVLLITMGWFLGSESAVPEPQNPLQGFVLQSMELEDATVVSR